MTNKKKSDRNHFWIGRVNDPLDLEPTNWELLTKGPKMGYYSAFRTHGKALIWGLLALVALFMGGILLIILFG